MMKKPAEVKILFSMLPYGFTSTTALKILFGHNSKYAYKALAMLQEKEFVQDGKRFKTENYVKYPVVYYSITIKGLVFLSQELTGEHSNYYAEELRVDRSVFAFLSCIEKALETLNLDSQSPVSRLDISPNSVENILNRCNIKMQESLLGLADVIVNPLHAGPYSEYIQSFFAKNKNTDSRFQLEELEPEQNETQQGDFMNVPCEAMQSSNQDQKTCEAATQNDDLKKHGTTIGAIIDKAKMIYRMENGDNCSSDVITSTEIEKPVFISRNLFNELIGRKNDTQYAFSQCDGIVLRDSQPLLTFHSGLSGTAWAGKGISNIRNQFGLLLSSLGFDGDVKDGILFIKNTFQFKNALSDKANKRKNGKKKEKTPLGAGMRHLYLVPATSDAEIQLRSILYSAQPKKDMNNSVSKMIAGSILTTDSEFPICSPDGTKYFNGLLMEAHSINMLIKRTQNKDVNFLIVCFDWQQKYYDILFPQIKKILISKNK